MSETLDMPFYSHPFMRAVFEIIEFHQEGDVTVIDKMEIKNIYIPPSADPEYHSSTPTARNEE